MNAEGTHTLPAVSYKLSRRTLLWGAGAMGFSACAAPIAFAVTQNNAAPGSTEATKSSAGRQQLHRRHRIRRQREARWRSSATARNRLPREDLSGLPEKFESISPLRQRSLHASSALR